MPKKPEPSATDSACRRMTKQAQLSCGGLEQGSKNAQKSRFSCAVRTKNTHDCSGVDVTGNPLQYGCPGKRFSQILRFNNPVCHDVAEMRLAPRPDCC